MSSPPSPPSPPSSDRYLITAALPYVNNTPHCGNLIGSTLSADFFARYCRLKQREVLFICGTDDYGTSTELKARSEGCSPREVCDRYRQEHTKLYHHLDLSFDYFGQTNTERHTEIVQEIAAQLEKNEFLIEKTATVFQCSNCQQFCADRFVTGQCPSCNQLARGDQCDHCQTFTHPSTLINPACSTCQTHLISLQKPHLFLDLEKMKSIILNWLPSLNCSDFVTNASVNHWENKTLADKDITRDLTWGVPVPRLKDQVFYVWFDAPIGYLSITAEMLPDTWQTWWKVDHSAKLPNQTKLYHFIGKDNTLFHSLYFPATLRCASDPNHPYIMPYAISCTQYLLFEGQKFSKSQQVGVFAQDIMSMNVEPDVWRFYLAWIRPETSDSNFSFDGLFQCREMIRNDIGNLVHRILSIIHKQYNQGLQFESGLELQNSSLSQMLIPFVHEFHQQMDETLSIRKALLAVMTMVRSINAFITQQRIWESKNVNELVQTCVWTLMALELLSIFMPQITHQAQKLFQIVGEQDIFEENDVKNQFPIRTWIDIECKPNCNLINQSFVIFVKQLPTPLLLKMDKQTLFSTH